MKIYLSCFFVVLSGTTGYNPSTNLHLRCNLDSRLHSYVLAGIQVISFHRAIGECEWTKKETRICFSGRLLFPYIVFKSRIMISGPL